MLSRGEDLDTTAAALCTTCGLCCQGLLHSNAVLRNAEVSGARSRQLNVIQNENGAFFKQPCPCLKGTECSIYESRFETCKGYQCKLLKSLLGGEITLDDSLAVVRNTKQIEADIRESVGNHSPTVSVWTAFEGFLKSEAEKGRGEDRRSRAELLMKVGLLGLMCNKYFGEKVHAAATDTLL